MGVVTGDSLIEWLIIPHYCCIAIRFEVFSKFKCVEKRGVSGIIKFCALQDEIAS